MNFPPVLNRGLGRRDRREHRSSSESRQSCFFLAATSEKEWVSKSIKYGSVVSFCQVPKTKLACEGALFLSLSAFIISLVVYRSVRSKWLEIALREGSQCSRNTKPKENGLKLARSISTVYWSNLCQGTHYVFREMDWSAVILAIQHVSDFIEPIYVCTPKCTGSHKTTVIRFWEMACCLE